LRTELRLYNYILKKQLLETGAEGHDELGNQNTKEMSAARQPFKSEFQKKSIKEIIKGIVHMYMQHNQRTRSYVCQGKKTQS